jgi:peptidoglycan/LPS O-acetylase OafA/YrhL
LPNTTKLKKDPKNLLKKLDYRPELDGLRAIAIALVLLFHLNIFKKGFLGVDVFFVISGYLITNILLNRKERLRNFYVRRLARLYPALLILILLYIISSLLLKVKISILAIVLALTYTMSLAGFIVPKDEVSGALTPTWSLSIEEFYYLLWPVTLYFLLKKIKNNYTIIILFLTYIGLTYQIQHYNYNFLTATQYYHSPLFRSSGILIGSTLALITNLDLKKVSKLVKNLMGLLVVTFTTFSILNGNTIYISLATAMLIYLLEKNSFKHIKNLLSSKYLTYIGVRSYGIYLYNLIIIELISKVKQDKIILNTLTILLILAVSTLSYKYVESPLRKLIIKRAVTND